jgi:hypothetical protein
MFDLNAEFLGLNRRKLESLPEYIKRVFSAAMALNKKTVGSSFIPV